ncbi:1-phosphofructokinase family hexose kinase [Rhodococcus maanshanensis]|uniref:1-phosphofructokinase n=1 Tax=Rhodococcus maanshanensis TaxID=183556 RepID=A0A1H7GGR2_9NOCA|nr:1-phosphofructokinase family hexose kinase [Rhodococcus maanshanensis]SEK36707.1 1-phosphofructokinase [Rhodococcus maanshanensis]
MIVTLTANPSLDSTVELATRLERGAVHRATATSTDPGGKGVNVARVVAAAHSPTVAILPARVDDPLVAALADQGIANCVVPTAGPVRGNLTITEPDGTTTKLNEPGHPLDAAMLGALTRLLTEHADHARWIALCGSLPPGAPDDWYGQLVRSLRSMPCAIAVDTSDVPLRALAAGFPDTAPDLVKPNAEELAQLTGCDAAALEAAAAAGDPSPTVRAALTLLDLGVGAVLATLGSGGAVLVTTAGAWFARAPRITPRSTVGAGDASLAGYLLATVAGDDPARALQLAVAYGTAAAGLPGTALPRPDQIDRDAVTVTALDVSNPSPRHPDTDNPRPDTASPSTTVAVPAAEY